MFLHRRSNRAALLICCAAATLSLWSPLSQAEEKVYRPFVIHSGRFQSALGVTRQGTSIRAEIMPEDLDFLTPKIRVLVVRGSDGIHTMGIERDDLIHLAAGRNTAGEFYRDRYLFSCVPCLCPDGRPGRVEHMAGGKAASDYPPKETAYDSPTNPEAIYLWRWIGMHAPDLVIDVRQRFDDQLIWEIPDSDNVQLQVLGKLLKAKPLEGKGELATALVKHAPCDTGTILALRVQLPADDMKVPAEDVAMRKNDSEKWLPQLLVALDEAKFTGPSPARAELQRRVKRTPLEVATELATIYGQDLDAVQYIPAMALVARVRLGQLTGDERQLADVERIVAPYYAGEKSIEIKDGSGISGHLIFTELARVTEGERRKRYLELAQAAANLAFDEEGKPREAMPFHSEMSDALFMGGPILAQVGELTGENRYFDACWRHLQFMRDLVRRSDGLYAHSPIGAHAWGRGNGFPALGLAMCIPYFPVNGSDDSEMLIAQRRHLETLLKFQDATGCWHQVIDHPESYRELTATAMIGYALSQAANEECYQNPAREKKLFQQAADNAWYAVNSRIGRDGSLVDVCTGTGKFKTLREYLDRPAILGRDARGGAMALLFAVEMAEREAQRKRVESK